MRNKVSKGITFVVVFLVSLFVIGWILNQGNAEIAMEMQEATLPVVSVELGKYKINTMFGYKERRQEAFMRENLTPIGEGRKVSLVVDTYGQEISSLAYEVRSADGERLIENNELPVSKEQGGQLHQTLQFKDLITADVEYSLTVILNLANGEKIRYYTRIVQTKDSYAAEKLEFVNWFHDITLGNTEGKEIVKYLEPNSRGDNSSFHKVDIHSSLKQVMWDRLSVKQVGEPGILLKQLDSQTGSFVIRYTAEEGQGRQKDYYFVEEYFRIRRTPDRIYLLAYERTAEQIFTAAGSAFSGNKITLGIGPKEIPMEESEGGKILAFVSGNRLFTYNAAEHKLAQVFSFYDKNNFDIRTTHRENSLQILNVEDNGNMMFFLSGYMNRGKHEGQVGVGVYYYNSVQNTIEEQVFVPFHKSADILQKDLEKIAYLNKSNHFFFMLDGNLYDVDLDNKSYTTVVSGIEEDGLRVSASGSMAAWQQEGGKFNSSTLVWADLNNGRRREIKAGRGERITAMGFMGEDLVYGTARSEEILKDSFGSVFFPIYKVNIQNQAGDILKSYYQENQYITDWEIAENQIALKRAEQTEGGSYRVLPDDHITSNAVEEAKANQLTTIAIDMYETIVQISLKGQIESGALKVLTPKEIPFEGGREVALREQSAEQEVPERYYVYGPYGVSDIYASPAEAVQKAYQISGVAADEQGGTVWKKGTKYTRNQIMAITGEKADEEKSSLAVCLDTMLRLEGISRESQRLLEQGEDAKTILQKNLKNTRVLDLTGCQADTLVFYMDQDIPVLALENGKAVLVIGFNEYNVVLMDPATGMVFKKGMNDSRESFSAGGNRFITYIRKEE